MTLISWVISSPKLASTIQNVRKMASFVHSYASMPIKRKHAAMILHGCGVYDGTEIHEATSMLIHLSKQGVKVSLYSLDKPQLNTVNHLTGETNEGKRNLLVESARIARGSISPLSEVHEDNCDSLFIPGGFGAANNLSDFALKGAGCSTDAEVANVIKKFHDAGKPIGLCCIAPVLAASCIPGVEVTLGAKSDASEAIEKMGAKHVARAVNDIHVDMANKVVTTPAYMCGDAALAEIFDGIGKLVEAVIRL